MHYGRVAYVAVFVNFFCYCVASSKQYVTSNLVHSRGLENLDADCPEACAIKRDLRFDKRFGSSFAQ